VHTSGNFVYATTIGHGLITYAVDSATGALTKIGTPVPGNYSVAVHPAGNLVYASDIVPGVSEAVIAYAVDSSGALTEIGRTPFTKGSGPETINIDPAGKFAYISEQLAKKVAAYSINTTTGALTPVPGGLYSTLAGPRTIAIDRESAFLYVSCFGGVADVGGLLGFSIDSSTGALTPVPGNPFHQGYDTWGIGIDRSGKFAYELVAASAWNLRTYAIEATGSLTEVPGSRLILTGQPNWLTLTH
jgi:6-phosphogluconolactonase (cycloisomerase 2 family)